MWIANPHLIARRRYWRYGAELMRSEREISYVRAIEMSVPVYACQ